MVQLLDQDGTLRYDSDVLGPYIDRLDPEMLRGFYRGHGHHPPLRPGSHRPAAAGRAGALGSADRAGSRADRLRPGDAKPQDYIFPTYREHGVALTRGVDLAAAAAAVPRHLQRRLEPQGDQLPPVHAGAGRPDAARRGLRDGHPAGPCRGSGCRPCRPRRGLLRRRRQLRRRRPRIHGLCRLLQGSGGLLLPEQPLGHLGAVRGPVADPAGQPRQRLRLPRHPGGRQ